MLPRHISYADRHPFQGIIAGAGICITIATSGRLIATMIATTRVGRGATFAVTAGVHIIVSATGAAIARIAVFAAGIHALAVIASGRTARRSAVPTRLVHIVHFDLQRM